MHMETLVVMVVKVDISTSGSSKVITVIASVVLVLKFYSSDHTTNAFFYLYFNCISRHFNIFGCGKGCGGGGFESLLRSVMLYVAMVIMMVVLLEKVEVVKEL